jgi:hypothetical protein
MKAKPKKGEKVRNKRQATKEALLREARKQPGVKEVMEVYKDCAATEQRIVNILGVFDQEPIVTSSTNTSD